MAYCKKFSFAWVLVLLGLLFTPWLTQAAPAPDALSQAQRTVTAVVRSQGAILYDRPGGVQVDTLVGGSLVTARLRTQDGQWVLVRTRDQVDGWVEASNLLAAGLNRLPVGSPEETNQATATPQVSPTPPPAEEATAAPTATQAAAPTVAPTATTAAGPAPTATPFTPPEGPTTLAIVRPGGASLWRLEDGSLAAQLKAGKRMRAAARSADNKWFFLFDETGLHGWANATEVLVVNANSLPIEPVVPADASGETAPADATPTPSPTPTATPTAEPTPTPQVEKVKVTVNDFGGRLNIRSGPGTASQVLARAVAGVTFNALGRDESGEWIQVAIPDLPTGAAWVSALFVTTSAPVESLPVVSP